MLIKDILNESFEADMAQIPNTYKLDTQETVDGKSEPVVYKWNKQAQTWLKGANKQANGRFTSWTPIPTQLVTHSKTKKEYQTKYSDLWKELTDNAISKLSNTNRKKTKDPATKTAPIQHEKKSKIGKTEYIYDEFKNQWFSLSTKSPVNIGSEAHAILMSINGYQPDGKTPLAPGLVKSMIDMLNKEMGGPLGVASQDKAKTWLGRQTGKVGDGLGRLLKHIMQPDSSIPDATVDATTDTDTDDLDTAPIGSDIPDNQINPADVKIGDFVTWEKDGKRKSGKVLALNGVDNPNVYQIESIDPQDNISQANRQFVLNKTRVDGVYDRLDQMPGIPG